MGHFCSVPGCSNRSDRETLRSYFCLPLRRKKLLNIWIHTIGRKNLLINYWGEPEQAPHIRDICKFCLSVCLSVSLSVGPYVHDTIIYKCYSNLLQLLIAALNSMFPRSFCNHTFKKHFRTNKLN